MDGTFQNNKADGRFEYHTDGSFAHADYRIKGDTLYIDYVEAPQALRGTGAASHLMEHIVAHAKNANLSITPICGYAAAWMKRFDTQTERQAS